MNMNENILIPGEPDIPETAQASTAEHPAGAALLPADEPLKNRRLEPVRLNFSYFAGLSLAFGLIYAFCLYKNPGGITYPLFVAAACLCGVLACRKLGRPVKRGSWFLLGSAILLGIGTCRTAEWALIAANGLALVLLGCVFGIHQFYEDAGWNIGKYLSSILLYLLHALGQLPLPFRHLKSFLKQQENRKIRRAAAFLAGILAAVPALFILTGLLSRADVVFSGFVHEIILNWMRPITAFHILFMVCFGFFAMYCLICCCQAQPLTPEVKDRRFGEPLAALAFMGSITLVYAVFCAIQIYCLFLGKGSLPEGYTYSSYARQGFFQLLFVAFLNLVMVLCCLKYIRASRILNVLLTVICGCTAIMLASAVYRMMLYVSTYHLTYLRLIVLWFLAMLAVLLPGVALIIWKPRFPLFRFSLTVVTVFYLALVWGKPGSVIGWDYVSHLNRETISESDVRFLIRGLSADAAPAIASLDLTWEEVKAVLPFSATNEAQITDSALARPNSWFSAYYALHAGNNYRNMGIRNYNFALAKVKGLMNAE